ncbi:MAG: anthranilate synthase component I family protein [Luminiphilus sp.]|nr:anthranilate synthase component I family protein [Luminiphilus sp.]MDG1461430.1 anthranilate synthase component I family protein [Luminiphilus sp.]
MKIHSTHCHPIPYSDDVTVWSRRFADLDGFAMLDSRKRDTDSGRYDIVTALPDRYFDVTDFGGSAAQWMDAIEADLDASPNCTSRIAIGFIDFETASIGALGVSGESLKPATAGVYSWYVLQDHSEQRAWLVKDPGLSAKIDAAIAERLQINAEEINTKYKINHRFMPDISREIYEDMVCAVRTLIAAGDCYQANIAQRFQCGYSGSEYGIYEKLRDVAPGDYAAFLKLGTDHAVISQSPERFLSVDAGYIRSQPIKGTRPRFSDPTQDAASAHALLSSVKDRAENIMIVDLLRNDLGKICQTGTVKVTELCELYSYDNVHHLVSRIEGRLEKGVRPGAALIAASPGGSITGAPKKRSVEIIKSLEQHPRGVYCGSVFAMTADGWLESSIAIRTLEAIDGVLYCWGGGGITWDSVPEEEYAETLAKVSSFMRALDTQ